MHLTRSDLFAAFFAALFLLIVLSIFAGCARRESQIEQQRADFQTISAALEQYKADFGDYPRNPALPGWNTQAGVNPAPFYPSLASALIGPGPAATGYAKGKNADCLEYGDGHDGPGFCCQPGGKVWGPYISPQSFRCVFISSAMPAGGSTLLPGYGRPVLLDRWGQVIQYFPRYGPVSDRTKDSTLAQGASPAQPVTAGPLFGYCQPKSVDPEFGQNCIFDWRDGATFYSLSASDAGWNDPNPVTNTTGYAEPWPDPTIAATSFHPDYAIRWMLGESDLSQTFHDAIIAGEKMNFMGPFILISAGPGGPDRENGGYCNMADPNGNPLVQNQLQQSFLQSGNIYNFDQP